MTGFSRREQSNSRRDSLRNSRRNSRIGVRTRNSAGFTLTEMLVVIAIIGVLASLITVAAMQVLDTGKQMSIKAEVDQLDMAFKDFKNKYGAYPPCDLSNPASNPALIAFIMQAFPRYNTGGPANNYNLLVNDWAYLGICQDNLPHPDRALVFWLSGFSPDVTSPFTGAGARTPFFTFDQPRLVSMTSSPSSWSGPSNNTTFGYTTQYPIGNYAYAPKYPTPNATSASPYAYIDANHYGTLGASPVVSYSMNNQPYTIYDASGTSHGIAAAYVQDLQNQGQFTPSSNATVAAAYQFCNPTTFQIISAGQDGQFGMPNAGTAVNGINNLRLYPTGAGYDSSGADTDNVSNFCDKSRLGDAIP